MMNEALRAALLTDLRAVRPLPSPLRRATAVVPLALLSLVAAPLVFDFRDFSALGPGWSWGASIAQTMIGMSAIALALREAVPGRECSTARLWLVVAAIVIVFLAVTAGSWSAHPVLLVRSWWWIGALCAVGSAVSALPAVALSSILIVRAFPLRPLRSGAIAGLGAGLLADAGWRLFCHFSEPAHVVGAHLSGALIAAAAGAALTSRLLRDTRRGRS